MTTQTKPATKPKPKIKTAAKSKEPAPSTPTKPAPETAPESPPESVAETPTSPNTGSDADPVAPDHFDNLISEAEAAEPVDVPEHVDAAVIGHDGLYTYEKFRETLTGGLMGAGQITALQTLLISPEMPTFPAASKALYETIKETSALHFLLRPGGKWFMRATAIGAFAVPVAMGCAAELKARRAVPEKPKGQGPEASKPGADAAPGQAPVDDLAAASKIGGVDVPPNLAGLDG